VLQRDLRDARAHLEDRLVLDRPATVVGGIIVTVSPTLLSLLGDDAVDR
jgi:hypothetical protein